MTPERFRQIEDLYHAAREDRAVLAKADPDLRREVESLLAQDSSKTGTLDHPAWEGAAGLTKFDATATVITPGTQLGPYKIQGPLGAGGMGEVFRAVDTRLGRAVAIKTSQQQFSERFEREARAISSLNHPHICTLYDVGPNYLVMELCEGETLAARLKKGKLSIDDTVRYGTQIADALAAAHAKGIVHRDLKPGNVMVTKSGVKVLDFGLAKSSQDETITASRMVMGTPAYMAPEQREGKECDARTDIYALGLVLYEMATGVRTAPDRLTPLESVSPQITHVLQRCLDPDPAERWQTASDVRRELEWAGKVALTPQSVAPVSQVRLVWTIALIACSAILAAIVSVYLRSASPDRPVQFSLSRTAYATTIPRLAPDGGAIVYPEVDASGQRKLWLRRLDSAEAKPLSGTEDALSPFWSPDGRWIGFYAQQKLKKVSRDGGSPQTIIALAAFDGTAAWSSTGEILYSPENRAPLYRIPDSGGTPRQVTKLDESRGENSHRFVRFLPDGKHFLFSARSSDRENNALYSGSVESGEIRRLAPIQSNVAYVPPREGRIGWLVFAHEGELYLQAFDGKTLSGEPLRLMDVGYNSIGMRALFDVSMDGRVLVSSPPSNTEQNLTWFDRKGMSAGTLGAPGEYQQPRISPDGTRVIFNRPDDNGGNRDVWLLETRRGIAARLTKDPANEWNDTWSPDGRRILFASDRGGHRVGSVWEKASMDPGAGERPVEGLPDWANPEDWSADGNWIAFSNGAKHGDVWIAPTLGDKKPFRFFDSGSEDRLPRFSPDGKWIAYHSNESGRFEIYVRPFAGAPDESGRKMQISVQGGFYATWSRDGKELFFLGPDSKLYAAAVKELDRTAIVLTPRPLFTICAGNTPTGASTQGSGFDVAPDGQKFLFACNKVSQDEYTVTVNWQDRK
jgi:Tol biopolymer transport system component